GIIDEKDKCPTVPGLAKYDGCPIPDTDKDGINDEEDKCPTVPGLARYQGCPIPDTDGDGVNDEEDKCPNLPGTKANQGCPEIKEEVKKKVDFAAKNILFVTGSYKLAKSSFKGLNDVVKILQDNPDLKMAIDGHTDNVGKDDFNQKLSESRANAVKEFFTSKGIAESRFTATGHGETMPIADNKTAAGRQKNRRVELKLSYY
ncbi:MAG TPA: OmpA family protein, partial [Chitinophagaceae bacterium]|nr:OmpA family protein [Chitinophagaceae bacterium]